MSRLQKMMEQAREKIEHDIEAVDEIRLPLNQNALHTSLTMADDDDAHELFDLVRLCLKERAKPAYDVDGYLAQLENLKNVCIMSGQETVALNLMETISFFESHRELVEEVLKGVRRQALFAGLRANYRWN